MPAWIATFCKAPWQCACHRDRNHAHRKRISKMNFGFQTSLHVYRRSCTLLLAMELCFPRRRWASHSALQGDEFRLCRKWGSFFMKSVLLALLSALQAKMRPDCWLTMYPRRGSNPHLLLICDKFQEGRQSTYTMETPYPLDHAGFCRRLPFAK